jgi:hypothetical protein
MSHSVKMLVLRTTRRKVIRRTCMRWKKKEISGKSTAVLRTLAISVMELAFFYRSWISVPTGSLTDRLPCNLFIRVYL